MELKANLNLTPSSCAGTQSKRSPYGPPAANHVQPGALKGAVSRVMALLYLSIRR